MIVDRELGSCIKCRQKLLLNQDKLCIHCELDVLHEQLALKDIEISKYRKKNNELYLKLSNALGELATKTGKQYHE